MRLHGVHRVHGYKLGHHWSVVYSIASLFYRVRRIFRKPYAGSSLQPFFEASSIVIRLDPAKAESQKAVLMERLKKERGEQ